MNDIGNSKRDRDDKSTTASVAILEQLARNRVDLRDSSCKAILASLCRLLRLDNVDRANDLGSLNLPLRHHRQSPLKFE